jgi:hypothetical protein
MKIRPRKMLLMMLAGWANIGQGQMVSLFRLAGKPRPDSDEPAA